MLTNMIRTEEFLDKVAQKSFPNMTKERQRSILDIIVLRLAQEDLVIVSRGDAEMLERLAPVIAQANDIAERLKALAASNE